MLALIGTATVVDFLENMLLLCYTIPKKTVVKKHTPDLSKCLIMKFCYNFETKDQ